MSEHTYKISFDQAQQKLIDNGRTIRFEKPELWRGMRLKQPIFCLICDHKWDATPSHIINNRGCPKCAGKIPLTNEIVDKDLEGRNITRLDDIINASAKINWKCNKCDNIWNCSPNNIRREHGCPKCAFLTNEKIDIILDGRYIKRCSDIIGSLVDIDWECLKCGNIWSTKPNYIQQGSGCPNCRIMSRPAFRVSFEEAQKRLIDDDRTVRFESPELWKGTNENCLVVCLVCDHKWNARADSVMMGHGCPNCPRTNSITNEKIDDLLKYRTIKRINDFIMVDIPFETKCDICGYIWSALYSNVCGKSQKGCPNCAGNAHLTNEIVDFGLIGRPIKRCGDVKNSAIKIQWCCCKCDYLWMAAPRDIRSGRGCPKCRFKNEFMVCDFIKDFVDDHVIFQWKIPDSKMKVDAKFGNVVVEYNGHQHYQPIKNWGGVKAFKKQQKRDAFVRRYCKKNNIQLIEIDGREYAGKTLIPYLQECLKPWIKNNLNNTVEVSQKQDSLK